MELNPYFVFGGRCEAAFKFYEKCLGGKIEMTMTYRDSPMAGQVPPGWKDKVLHTRMTVGNRVLMGSDGPPDHHEEIKGFSMSIGVDSPAEAERIFNALTANGTVRMPLQKTFWAASFGMLVDQFGVSWMVNCEQADSSR